MDLGAILAMPAPALLNMPSPCVPLSAPAAVCGHSLMVRSQWCPCTYGHGETLMDGLRKLDDWLMDLGAILAMEVNSSAGAAGALNSRHKGGVGGREADGGAGLGGVEGVRAALKDSLCHIREAASLLVRPRRTRTPLPL